MKELFAVIFRGGEDEDENITPPVTNEKSLWEKRSIKTVDTSKIQLFLNFPEIKKKL